MTGRKKRARVLTSDTDEEEREGDDESEEGGSCEGGGDDREESGSEDESEEEGGEGGVEFEYPFSDTPWSDDEAPSLNSRKRPLEPPWTPPAGDEWPEGSPDDDEEEFLREIQEDEQRGCPSDEHMREGVPQAGGASGETRRVAELREAHARGKVTVVETTDPCFPDNAIAR